MIGFAAKFRRSAVPHPSRRPLASTPKRFCVSWVIRATSSGVCAKAKGVSEMGKATLGLLLVVVSACTPAPQANLILGSVTPAPARIDAELASVSVEPAGRDRAVDPLPPSLAPLLPPWRAALQDALARKAIFRPGAPRRLSLMVKVLQYAVSGDTLTLFARYQLFENLPGDPIFSADVMTNVPVGSGEDAASALSNRALASRAIQANIVQFLDQLEAFAPQQHTGALLAS
jgi:hypothetical protein